MAPKTPAQRTSRKLANDLVRQRTALVKSNQRRSELAARVKGYEGRYGIKSRSVHAAINRGELKETQEVCRWIMDYDLLKRSKTC